MGSTNLGQINGKEGDRAVDAGSIGEIVG
jgi:hypothetical protein